MACGLLPKFPFEAGRSVSDQVGMIQLEDEDVVDWQFKFKMWELIPTLSLMDVDVWHDTYLTFG